MVPDKVQVPEPTFITLPEVVTILPAKEPAAAPPKVRSNVLPAIFVALLNAILPAPVPLIIELLAANVICPAYVAAVVLLLLKSAPLLATPVPLKVKEAVEAIVLPLRSIAAPELTVITPLPNGLVESAFNIPAETVVPPP